ncbi:MAG: gliding motility-associated C-terminal domain-containing protein [Bacteroidetes bacterium]|nr:gliding motility-associated C-terminal domain-containing protein [Bacteroidota bacterium]
MFIRLKHIFLSTIAVALSTLMHAHVTPAQSGSARFIQNKGQWPKQVLFGARISSGMLFIENNGITFNIYDPSRLHEIYENIHHHQPDDQQINAQSFKIEFKNAALPSAEGKNKYADCVNYFLGNDPSKWASNVAVFNEVYLHNIYPGIDIKYYEKNGHLKYDFIIQPGSKASQIQFEHHSISAELKNNEIHLHSRIGEIVEQAPFTYQNNTAIASQYFKNEKGFFTFKTASYNNKLPLIIDPVVLFASFSGSTSDNWGYTATYDESGKLYDAGIVFGNGYPANVGAYSTTFSGNVDLSITKYSSTGGSLIYSTYMGGNDIESPHSIVVTKQNELVIFGSTSSVNYPTTLNAYDKTFNGGINVTTDVVLTYSIGSDIFVSKLNATGSALVGSTLIGGSSNDGLNDEFNISKLYYNYGDIFRGEVIVDSLGNPYIATTTSSANFPIVSGYQNVFAGGSHDGIIMKLNNDLSSLLWSSYLGGNADDAIYSVQFDSNNDLYVTGGTVSPNFPTTPGVLHSGALGGIDGFIAHFSANGQTLKAATYIGTNAYDQSYFVQLDKSNNVFVFGQSEGAYPVAPAGVYSNAGSHQFIHKLNSALSSTVFSSVIGSGSMNVDLIPSAFLVNNCEDIYISAWGGIINGFQNNVVGSTVGMPLTTDAYQSTTDGSDFYLAVFSQNMGSLKYGTYFGGPNSLEHVDGGTSRFDKKGNVYQAVCGGCGGMSDFPTTPGAWSNTNKSDNCNLAVIKFDISKLTAIISANSDSLACKNEPITFSNQSNGGKFYEWDFGNGDKSTEYSPTYTYQDTGLYKITLLALDPGGCPPVDTTYMSLRVVPQVDLKVSPNDSVCPGSSVTLTASGATIYQWKPGGTLNQTSGTSVIATPLANTTYTVNGNSFCNKDSAQLTISLFSLNHTISPMDSVCPGVAHPVAASTGNSFQWTPSQFFSNANTSSTEVVLNQSTTIHVAFKTIDGCDINDSIQLKVIPIPNFNSQQDSLICLGKSLVLDPGANGNYDYQWTPASTLNDAQIKNPLATPKSTTLYQSVISNMCGKDSTTYLVTVSKAQGTISSDTTICRDDSIPLLAKGALKYLWTPAASITNDTIANPSAFPQQNTTYKVIISNNDGCIDSLFTTVSLAEKPFTGFNGEYVLEYGEDLKISSNFEDRVSWSPSTYLSCTDCADPVVSLPERDITYQYTLFDDKGCYFKDSLHVYVIRKVYVPNAFTPNGDNTNDVFYFRSISVDEFQMDIFNRWGELLFTSYDINTGWDGTYKNRQVQIDTYVWKVRYRRYHKETWHEEIGKVSVIR